MSSYAEPLRPYSRIELKETRDRAYRGMRLSKTRAHHKRCNHFYYVRENGRKEKEMIESKTSDCGNCSVCWKLGKTPRVQQDEATSLVNTYCNEFHTEPEQLTFTMVELEVSFYTWLYMED
jgi:hypothetical protein